MATIDVPAHEWPEFLEAFSRQHRAWLTRIEPALNGFDQALPLGTVTTERDGRRVSAIEVSFAGNSGANTLRIENPISVRIRQTAAGTDQALEITDDDGFCTRLGFRTVAPSDMLDGLAPGELSDET
jgi:hypothetical protein